MRTVKKNVYYCDFCRKKSLKSLKDHELHCTGNLDRECKLCKEKHNYREIINLFSKRFHVKMILQAHPLFDESEQSMMIESVEWVGEKLTGKEVLDAVDGCPICALTIVKGLAINKNVSRLLDLDFDYKKELGLWWDEQNSLRREYEYNY